MARDYDKLLLHCASCDRARKRADKSCGCGEQRPAGGWSVDPEESGAIVVFLTKRLGKRYAFYEIVEHWAGTVVFRAQTTGGLPVRFALITAEVGRGFSAEFHKQGRVATTLDDPRIIALLDHGTLKDTGHYAVFAHPRGHTLEEELTKGPLDLVRATKVMRELAHALSSLHQQGLALGLLTPQDILINEDSTGQINAMIPSVDWLLGVHGGRTPGRYAAPEVHDGPAQPASDQYTLGRMMLEAFTGLGRKTAPGEVIPKVPGRIETMIRTMLQPDPSERLDDLRAAILMLESRAQKLSEAKTVVLDDAPSGMTPYPREPTPPPVPSRLRGVAFEATPAPVPVVRWGSEVPADRREAGPPTESRLPLWMGLIALGVATLGLATAVVSMLGPTSPGPIRVPGTAEVSLADAPIAQVTAEPEDKLDDAPVEAPPPAAVPQPVAPPRAAEPQPAPAPQPAHATAAQPQPAPAAPAEPEPTTDDVPQADAVATAPEPEPEVAEPVPAPTTPPPEPAFSTDDFVGIWRGESRGIDLVLDLKLSPDGSARGDIRLTQGTKVSADRFGGSWSRDGAGIEVELTLSESPHIQYIGVLSGDLATGTVVEKGRTRGSWSARL